MEAVGEDVDTLLDPAMVKSDRVATKDLGVRRHSKSGRATGTLIIHHSVSEDHGEPRRSSELIQELRRLHGKPYGAYHDLQGSWRYDRFLIHIDHVQADPFASPSTLRLQVVHGVAQFPQDLFSTRIRNTAFCDYLTRGLVHTASTAVAKGSRETGSDWGSVKGGDIMIDRPGQQVIQRSSVVTDDEGIELRFALGLPAQGRTILGDWATEIYQSVIPQLADSLHYQLQNEQELDAFVKSLEDQEDLRNQMRRSGLVAFVANGAILPRMSGASDLPLSLPGVVPFQSPANLEQIFILPNRGQIKGMGIPEGITMVAGGGFHGKSTLLDALATGCYNHIPGDGREFVVTSPKCVSVQGEDGRSIQNIDISPFINNLPGGTSTTSFSTQDASGSTSMAAGIVEVLEMGADTILLDEDTCATNFLIRDRRMQMLISRDPITPLIFKVRSMYRDHKCSSILVIGGCGDYCDVADLVLEMRDYGCYDITKAARRIAQEIPSVVANYEVSLFGQLNDRQLGLSSLPSPGSKTVARGRSSIQMGDDVLDLAALGQLVHDSQTRSVAAALKYLSSTGESTIALKVALEEVDRLLDERGLALLMGESRIDGFLARPRMLEIGMALNRLRAVYLRYNSDAV